MVPISLSNWLPNPTVFLGIIVMLLNLKMEALDFRLTGNE